MWLYSHWNIQMGCVYFAHGTSQSEHPPSSGVYECCDVFPDVFQNLMSSIDQDAISSLNLYIENRISLQ